MEGEKKVSTSPQSSGTSSNSLTRSSKSCCTFDLSPPSTSSFLSRHFQFLKDDEDDDLFMIQRNRILQMLQDVINRYNECFGLLRRAIAEIEVLSEEKMELSSEFFEMSRMMEEHMNELGGERGKENVPPNPPNPALVVGGNGNRPVSKRIVPKSISVRSRGFLSVKNPISTEGDGEGSSSSSDAKLPHRLLVPVPGQVEGEDAGEGSGLELEVYDQGMAKTELCNKWEEMAWCPYGSQCQFAHGMAELRPVIRHPRYKTQLCRMVTAPGGCPYGHRCHFRHAMDNPEN